MGYIRLVTKQCKVHREWKLPEPGNSLEPVIGPITDELTKNPSLMMEVDPELDPAQALVMGMAIANYRPSIYHRANHQVWSWSR